MRSIRKILIKARIVKKFLISYIVVILLLGSFAGMLQILEASESEPNDLINLNPADGSTNVSVDVNLVWSYNDFGDLVTYDVFFGDMSPPTKVVWNQSDNSHDSGTLAYNTTYYWQIVAWNDTGNYSSSSIWEFTTEGEIIDEQEEELEEEISEEPVEEPEEIPEGTQEGMDDSTPTNLSSFPPAPLPAISPPTFNGPIINTTIKGSVNTTGDIDLEDVNVSASNQSYGLVNYTFTSVTGDYEFNISGGDYNISFTKTGYNTSYFNSSFTENSSYWLNMTLNSSEPPPPSGNSSISGYVLTPSNNSIAGADVEINKDGGGYSDSTQTDQNGYYNFSGLEVGTYDLVSYKPGLFSNVYHDDVVMGENKSIENLNFTASVAPIRGISFSGYVYQDMTPDVPVIGANVTVETNGDESDIRGYGLSNSLGYFEFTFIPNEDAVYNQSNDMLRIRITKNGYVPLQDHQGGTGITEDIYSDMWEQEEWYHIEKIYNITAYAYGFIYRLSDSTPIDNATIMVEDESTYFMNQTQTLGNGSFMIGLNVSSSADFEFGIWKEGYFRNETDLTTINESDYYNLSTIYLEVKPENNAYIEGFINCSDQPLQYIELSLYDPTHPFEVEKEDMPRTNSIGYFNISTYNGTFYIITMAQMIGQRKDGPPLAIGGYDNEVVQITVAANETKMQNITLNASTADDFQMNISFSQWNITYVNMSRTIRGNAKILLLMADLDIEGNISSEEASSLESTINNSLSGGGGMFSEEGIFLDMPKDSSSGFFKLDGVSFITQSANIEFSGLLGSYSFLGQPNPITVYVNNTIMTAAGQIDNSSTSHSMELYGFYANPAFNTTYDIHFPTGYNVSSVREEMVNITGVGTPNVRVVPVQDPNWNDTQYYETVAMLIGTPDVSAFFDGSYSYNNAIDADSDGLYDYLMRKIKFNTNTSGSFKVYASLRSSSGTTIDTWTDTKSYGAGENIVQFSFLGSAIYRKAIDGPYNVVVDLYYVQNSTETWLDYMSQTTPVYNYTAFDPPAIFFTGTTHDYGYDSDNDGLYDFLYICTQVDVGDTGDYTFEGDIDIVSFSGGDTWITRSEKTTTFFSTGLQWYNLSFDGTEIYSKGQNASIWARVRVRHNNEWNSLDEIEHMTEKYFYNQFALPPPENSSVNGTVTDAFGNPIEAEIRLEDKLRFSENNTQTNANGYYQLSASAGVYRLEVWCTNSSQSLKSHDEMVVLETNESLTRNIRLLPRDWECSDIWWEMEDFQYAQGANIYLNLSTNVQGSSPMPYSNATLEIYKEYRHEDEYWGDEYVNSTTNVTDSNGNLMYVINTSGFSTGWYNFWMDVTNSSLSPSVATGDIWGVQISSLSLDFDLDKNKYKKDSTGTFTFNLTYISNGTCVENAEYKWKIMYWDWTEHILASETFTNESGFGSRTFTVPSTVQDGQWYEMQLIATAQSGSQVVSWSNFGATSGSVIDSVNDSAVGTPGNYDSLVINVSVDMAESGDYRVEGCLKGQNNEFIAWNETQQYLNAGSQTVQLFFDGEAIQSSGVNPYRAWVGLFQYGQWDPLDELDLTLSESYSYGDFASPPIWFNRTAGITDFKNGTVGDYEALHVNFTVIGSVAGSYSIHGNLFKKDWQGGWYDWIPVAWNCTDVEIVSGVNNDTDVNISVRFEGSEIYNSKQNAPYYVNLNLHQGNCGNSGDWISGWEPDTDIYANYSEFAKPIAFIENITDYGPVNGDLIIGVQINITTGNNAIYQINSRLHSSEMDNRMFITETWDTSYLDNGTTVVNLTFSGDHIYSKGYNGPYKLDVDLKRVDPCCQWLGWNEYDTEAYNYSDFSTPNAMFIGTYLDQGVDSDGDGYYDYIQVTVPVNFTQSGHYEICGEMYQEENWNWQWITWTYIDLPNQGIGEDDIVLTFDGNEIANSGLEGYYGVNLWLRNMDQGVDIGNLDFTTANYYYLNEFDQPSVRFTDSSPLSDSNSSDCKYINVSVAINASEVGTYYIHGDLHKVIQQSGWQEWIWITGADATVVITTIGDTSPFNVSFDTAMIQSSGYDGPYNIHFDLMDSNWNNIDFIDNYLTSAYLLSDFADAPANFTGSYDDYLYPTTNPEYVRLNVTIDVNESGTYSVNGDIHKSSGWNWNFIAGSGTDQYLSSGTQNITLQFDAVEILSNIESLGLSEFDSGSTFDIDVWLKRSGEWTELDHLGTVVSKNTYSISNFTSSLSASIVSVTDNGYNVSANNESSTPNDYLNITVTINFTQVGNYELWCDLGKDDGYKWNMLGWENSYETITSSQLSGGYYLKNITLQFSGERINSGGWNGPYSYHMELNDLDNSKRVDMEDSQTSAYNYSDFVGSTVEFVDGTASAVGVDSSDAGSEYDYLLVSVNVSAQSAYNSVELRGDLHKDSPYGGWQWISWGSNWTSLSSGDNTLTLQFAGEIIRNSGIDGPYQVRLELWDTSTWDLLDTIERIDTITYTNENFQTPSASFIAANISDWGNDTDSDGSYDYLEINASISCTTPGTYEVSGELFSDDFGWIWFGWANEFVSLSAGESVVKLQFEGTQIRNKDINGRYKARLALRDSNGQDIDSVDPYTTEYYNSADFQSSGAEFVSGSVDDRIISSGDYLDLNVTVSCSSNATYWIGADLHKESGWDWDFIAFESKEQILTTGQTNITILFNGETIRNSGIDGPYQIRLELRDTATWSEQDLIERHTTNTYYTTDFSQPSVSFVDINISDWGNDTDSDDDYNYLEFNVTFNCSEAGVYWLHGDIQKKTDYYWQWISWKGKEVSLTGNGDQIVKLQFDGELINSSGINGPYSARLEIINTSSWTTLDIVEEYTTTSYQYNDFDGSSIQFVEANITDRGNDTDSDGDYNYLDLNLTIDCSEAGTYWLHADIHKVTGWNWQPIAWDGQEITLDASGEQDVKIQFDGSQIRNKGIDGPYQLRFELNSVGGEFRQYDTVESYTTINSYLATDFESAGVELVEMTDEGADIIASGNLQVNVTINSSTTGTYEIFGDLFKESGWDWQWITWKSVQVEVSGSGEQKFALTFDGGDIYDKGIDGPYNVRLELRDVGSGSMIDSIDKYTTNGYTSNQFSTPAVSINGTDDFKNNGYLQLNVSTYSESSDTYQVVSWLHGANWEYITWNENTTTVNGLEDVVLLFDGSIINSTGIDPAKLYIEVRKISNWDLVGYGEYALSNTYSASDFGADVEIDTSSVASSVWNSDADDYNNSLNVTVNVTFAAGNYTAFAGLVDQNGTWIAGAFSPTDSYSGLQQVNFLFDGLTIYMLDLDGPYTVRFISIAKEDGFEVAREKNVHTTASYNADIFEHPDGIIPYANLTGAYSSYVEDTDTDSYYDWLVVNVSVDIGANTNYKVYGDIMSSDGSKWIAGASNNTGSLSTGTQVVQLEFSGVDIYEDSTNGPYLLGFVRVEGNASGTWVKLDEASNAHTTSSYSYTDFENTTTAPLVLSDVISVSVSNNPFSPNSDGAFDTTLATVEAGDSQTLYLNVYNSSSVLKRTGIALSEISSGTYTATWNGNDDSETVVSDGTYTIKVSDEATGIQANESTEEAANIDVDTYPPTSCSVEINSGDTYTNSTSVNLTTITATDDSSIKMRFQNSGENWTEWQDFQGTKAWTLTSTDGSKTVNYEAKDVVNNTIISSVSDSITLDTTNPTVNMSIVGAGDTPSTHSNNVSVTLSIAGSDATSGVEYMKISNDIGFTGSSWINYTTSKAWTLNSGDGTKTVYIKVKDRAGKESVVSSDNITLDTVSPLSLTISIDSGQTYTNSTNVTLSLSATNALKMQVSNYANFSGAVWESYSTSKNFSITDGNGTRKVYFRAKDTAGNIATGVNDSIILDKATPEISSVSSSGVSQSSATITWTTDEASTSYVEYGTTTGYGSNTTLNSTKAMSHSQIITSLNSGTTYHYRVRSLDGAGNEAISADNTFSTTSGGDTTSPDAITGLTVSDKQNDESTLTLSWSQSDAPDFAGYNIYRKANASFVNISASGVQQIKTITSRTTTTYNDNTSTDDYTYYYAVTAFDTASPANENQTVTSQYGTSIDDKAPTTTDNFAPSWYTSEKTVIFTATDGGKGVNSTFYTTDGSDPTNTSNSNRTQYTMPFAVGGENSLGDDIYNISYYSYDLNATPNIETTHSEILKVDASAPYTTDNAPSGWQNSSVTVALNSIDDTSGVYATYYTTDGSWPDYGSSQYSEAIEFSSDGNNTLRYFARDNATNDETNMTTYILIDATLPTSSIQALSTYKAIPFNVTWSSSDATSGINNVTLEYKNGSGSWTNWLTGQNAIGTASFNGSFGSAGYTYYFRSVATDNASNTESVTTYDAYTTVLTSALDVEITSPVDADDGFSDGWIYVNGTITITGTASGTNLTIWYLSYSADGSNWTNIANSTTPVISDTFGMLDTTGLAETNYTVELTAINATSNNSVNITITVDNAAPSITAGPESVALSSSATITWTTNESANATVQWGTTISYSGTPVSRSQLTFETSHKETINDLDSSTTYHYRVISYDKAGNMVNSSDGTFTTDEGTEEPNVPGPVVVPPLTADAGGPYEGSVGVSITFDGSGSSSTSGEITGYKWDFENDGTYDTDYSSSATTTHTYTAAGEYTVKLGITNSIGSSVTDTATVTISEAPEEDSENPTISNIYHSPSTVTKDDVVTIYATVTDDQGITSVYLYWYDDSDHSKSMTSNEGNVYYAQIGPFSAGISVQYSVDATDTASKTTQSDTFVFNIAAVAVIGNVSSGETEEILSGELEGTGLDGLEFTSATDLTDVKVIIQKLTEKPNEISEEPTLAEEDINTTVYVYLEINLTSGNDTLEEDDIESIKIKFKIEQEWLTSNNINKSKVILMRYHNDIWQELPTTILNESGTYVYYEATTKGTSTFAIVGGEIAEIGSGSGGGEEEPSGIPMWSIILFIVVAIILLIVILFKTGFLFLEQGSEEEIKKGYTKKTEETTKENTDESTKTKR